MESTQQPRSTYEEERAELAFLLASGAFQRAPRLSKILKYLCEKHFEGKAGEIKEYNIAVDALERETDFSSAEDSIVRVELSRLRKRLREFYQAEGKDRPMRILLPDSGYLPRFVRTTSLGPADGGETPLRPSVEASAPEEGDVRGALWWRAAVRRRKLILFAGLAVLGLVGLGWFFLTATGRRESGKVRPAAGSIDRAPTVTAEPAVMDQAVIRICVGRSGEPFVDTAGRRWSGDSYFAGGTPIVRPNVYVRGTPDPDLYKTAREGTFRYDIPLQPGIYELHLHLAETVFLEEAFAEGVEGRRTFDVVANGKPLMTGFDVVDDVGGSAIADTKVFTGMSPAADGALHLEFSGRVVGALLSGIEVLPGLPGKMQPVRIVAGPRGHVDSRGQFWGCDRYYLGGRLSLWQNLLTGNPDAALYAQERWGHFGYLIPVARGSEYSLRLLFAETYYGRMDQAALSRGSGAAIQNEYGHVFDVYCNGVKLLSDFDMLKEAGGTDRPVEKTFRNMLPNAQDKLALSFVPGATRNASVRAIEVLDESPGTPMPSQRSVR